MSSVVSVRNRYGTLIILSIFSIVYLFSLYLRLNQISYSGFNYDEMISLKLSENLNFKNIFLDNHPPLYLLLLKIFTSILGLNEFSARLESALFSAFATALIGYISYLYFGRLTTFFSMLLHATLPLSIQVAQLARPYATLEFFCLLQFLLFIRTSDGTIKKRFWLITISAITFLTSYISVLLFICELIFYQIKKGCWRQIFGSVFLIFILILLSRELIDWKSLGWQTIRYRMDSLAYLPLEVIWSYLFSSWFAALGVFLCLLLSIRQIEPETRNIFFMAMVSIMIIFITLSAFSVVSNRAVFLNRYFACFAPIILIGLSKSLSTFFEGKKIKNYFVGIFAISFILTGAGNKDYNLYPIKQSPWREAAERVSNYPRSIVVTAMGSGLNFPYFYRYNTPMYSFKENDQISKRIQILLEKFDNVWVVDSFWNYLSYKNDLLKLTKLSDLKFEDFTQIEESVDNIILLKINKVKKSE
jgi:uncharacterized membrane protein